MRIMSRKSARKSGKPHDYTGEPCLAGHIAQRYTVSRNCVICDSEYHRLNPKTKIGRPLNIPKKSDFVETKYRIHKDDVLFLDDMVSALVFARTLGDNV